MEMMFSRGVFFLSIFIWCLLSVFAFWLVGFLWVSFLWDRFFIFYVDGLRDARPGWGEAIENATVCRVE